MRFSDSEQSSNHLSVSPDMPGPSSVASSILDGLSSMNGHSVATANGNGVVSPPTTTTTTTTTNGAGPVMLGNGVSQKNGKAPAVATVRLPGTALYEDSFVNREEFIRLVIQSLRDVGYIESAATLEAESGYSMESVEVSQFRQYVLDGMWLKAEATLPRLFQEDDEGSYDARFLISQQKYLELLEAKKTTAALQVLRNELAPLNTDPEQLHTLSSFIMCSDPQELRQRTGWDGASGSSRQQLLADLQGYIPSSVMIPQRRLATLLHQAREYQYSQCVYHNSPLEPSSFSLYTDHHCNKSDFPSVTTTILQGHSDEVWNMQWSHNGMYLASSGKDKTAIIWKTGSSTMSGALLQDWTTHHMLKDHPYPVGCLAWSLDDSVLLTSSEHHIKMWNVQTGLCIESMSEHTETVTALAWLPDGSGFMSGALDGKIIHWTAEGKLHESWGVIPIRVTDLAITPDYTRLVTIGMDRNPPPPEPPSSRPSQGGGDQATPGGNGGPGNAPRISNKMIIYDLSTKTPESTVTLEGELTSVKISQNSRYALINLAPDEIRLWDLDTNRVARKYTGQKQGRHVIRSCFGGVEGNFVVSGSEDSKVYVWHRDSGALLEELPGHGEGSVNSVAWNPRNERMFASCSDDKTIRIWEAPQPVQTHADSELTRLHRHVDTSLASNGKGKGRSRQRWASSGNGTGGDLDVVGEPSMSNTDLATTQR